MRTAAKRDAAEPAIVEALEAICEDIVKLSSPNAPDLLVRFRGRWTPLAVKTPKIGRLTKSERERPNRWPLVKTADEALKVIGSVPKKSDPWVTWPTIRCSCGAVWRGKYAGSNPVIQHHRDRPSCVVTVEPPAV